MRLLRNTLTILIVAFSSFQGFSQGSENYCVTAQAVANSAGTSITLNFVERTSTDSIIVYRKDFGTTSWSLLVNLGSNVLTYEDKTISNGKMYDYFIARIGKDGTIARGYLTAGANVQPIHDRGAVLLLIDSMIHANIQDELSTLRMDLVGDGNQVLEYVVSPSEDHIAIRAKIKEYKSNYSNLEHVYILGHVAVPYSGVYCEDTYANVPPDGHDADNGAHCGAWPSDVYYGELDGNWTDNRTVTTGTRALNRNEPDDGKFDQIFIPGTVTLGIGRVDLSNLPKFSKTEIELTKQYIQKVHDYRFGISKPVGKALIDENFQAKTHGPFAASGYRFFGAVVGNDSVNTNDYMTTLKDEQYIMAYGTGPGSFTSAGGIGTTDNYVANQGAAYFNMVFGSFFGDWNVANNFLRAPLAVDNGGLTNAWAGRPNWHMYPMALNQTIGYCTQLTQNNKTTYDPGFFPAQIHIALMGDPTLRLHVMAAPSDVVVTSKDNNEKVSLSWTASNASVDGYNVYYSHDSLGPYTKANASLITGTSFEHTAPHNGKVYYMVRAQRLESTYSGSFYNLSQGSFGSVDGLINLSVDKTLVEVDDLKAYPNPSNGLVDVQFVARNSGNKILQVIDLQGNVLQEMVLEANGFQKQSIDLSQYAYGLYLIKVNNQTVRVLKI